MPFGKFDSCQQSEKSLVCQTYSNSSIAKAEVALMTLGKTSFCDIAAHQKDDLFATLGRFGYQLANELRPGNRISTAPFDRAFSRRVAMDDLDETKFADYV